MPVYGTHNKKKGRFMIKLFYLLTFILLASLPAEAQYRYQKDFTAEDFLKRRTAVYEEIGDNLALIQGAEEVQGFIVFRQSNTFYYLSGLEVPTSYLLLDGKRKTTTLYITHGEGGSDAVQLSYEDAELVKKITGVDSVRPLEKMGSDLIYNLWSSPVAALYVPHSPDEKHQQSRDEILAGFGRRLVDPFDSRPSKAGHLIHRIRTSYPQFEIRDLTPILDVLRSIKDEKEINLIRKASQLAGLGIMEAIRSTKPGVKEYQLEAAASFVFKNNGARGLSYHAIVASGKNTWQGHYSANSDTTKDGDLVLMDLAPDYHYYTSDVTRMWPINGKYTKDQRDLYGFVIEYHKALMRHLRPGVSWDQVLDEAAADMRKVLDKMTFSKEIYRQACEDALKFRGHLQHAVGMNVHDIDPEGNIVREGTVFSVDPMIWVRPEKKYIRMEDVVVITKDGVENLSANLPIEMDDIEALWKQEGIVQKRPPSLDKPYSTK
jgi:Xaa-Pro aminopeptidase